MDRRVIKTLIIDDNDLNCKCEDLTINELNITHVGFSTSLMDNFDMIIYSGKKGSKIIKSKYTKTGKIG